MDYILPILHKIKDMGISISLDDFGTGYSSLSILKNLPIDELKIDKSFVDDLLIDSEDAALVKSIVKIGNNLLKDTLAEGTETLEQVAKLKEYGCKIFQGYYFSKPLTKDELIIFLTQYKKI
jgi:EAL domain-containing protein (putative c-di-GMP-specific phosphodiesterase class I)